MDVGITEEIMPSLDLTRADGRAIVDACGQGAHSDSNDTQDLRLTVSFDEDLAVRGRELFIDRGD